MSGYMLRAMALSLVMSIAAASPVVFLPRQVTLPCATGIQMVGQSSLDCGDTTLAHP